MRVSIGEPMVKLDSGVAVVHREEWPAVLDKLILGVTHHISNRVATLAGVSDILAGDPTVPPVLRALADEVPKLEEAIRLLRLLSVPTDESDEPIEATRIVDDAVALAQLHPDCNNVTYLVDDRDNVPPVVARPSALTHELLVLLTSACVPGGSREFADADSDERASSSGTEITIRFSVDGADLVISAVSSSVRARILTAR